MPTEQHSPAPMVAVGKIAFLRAVAAHDAVKDSGLQRPDAAGDVATAYLLRAGVELGRTIDCPRRPLTKPTRYFLNLAHAMRRQEHS